MEDGYLEFIVPSVTEVYRLGSRDPTRPKVYIHGRWAMEYVSI